MKLKRGQRYYHVRKDKSNLEFVEEIYPVKMSHFKSGYGYYTDATPMVRGLDERTTLYESREEAQRSIHNLFTSK